MTGSTLGLKINEPQEQECPRCGTWMQAKGMPFNIEYRCPDCGLVLWQDRRTGKLREPRFFDWKGD